ncbi:MAG: ATP-dependent DNA helicase [Naasia sp.]
MLRTRSAPPSDTPAGPALDESQLAVLALPVGASAVVAGAPGTGKTTALIELVARRLLVDGLRPEDVLVLAPTRATATALRDRLARRVGLALPGPLARTAASVAAEIARADAAARGGDAPRLLTGAEQDGLIADLLDGGIEAEATALSTGEDPAVGPGPRWPDALSPDIRRLSTFRTELRELLARCQEADVTPTELSALGARLDRPAWVAAGRFFESYYSVLDSYRGAFLDSAEMLAEAVAIVASGRAVRMPELVLVDDAQELTVGVIELLAGWARAGACVVAFGDPDVAVTGFRGGRGDLLAVLGAQLRLEMPLLALTTSHRAAGPAADLLRGVVERIGASGITAHRSSRAEEEREPTRILRIEAPTRADEAARLARRLRELHVLDGVPWESMAVVLRSGAAVPSFARSLSLSGVPTRTSLAPRALRDEWAAAALVRAVAVAIDPGSLDIEAAHELLLGPLGGIDILALRRLRLALRHEELAVGGTRSADELLVAALADPGMLEGIDSAVARRAARLAETLAEVRAQDAATATIDELLWTVWDRSRLAASWAEAAQGAGVLADEADRHLDSVVALFASAERSVERTPERAAGEFVADFFRSDLPEDSLAARSRSDAVLVSTAAALIGLEFDVVAVAALQDGVWPNPRLRSSLLHADELADALGGLPLAVLDARAAVLHDELRMFALAVSRARRLLILGAVASADEQPSALLRLIPADTPVATEGDPLTLRGLVGRLRRELASGRSPQAAPALARLAAEGVPGASVADWYGVREVSTTEPLVDLTDPEARVHVSPSRLATIEKSPLGWFVDTMAAGSSGFKADLGTLLHSAMETLSTTPDAALDVDAVMEFIDARWHEFRFDSDWEKEFERGRARGRAAGLADYLTTFAREGHALAGAETQFSFELGSALVRGSIDRIEHTTEGTVVIVDLKTGSTVPSATELPGHAQLGLYQLAAEHDGLPGLPVDALPGGAKLVFVHEGTRGRLFREYRQEPLSPEELDAFRQRVAAAAQTMAGTLFPGVEGLAERDPHGRYPYRVHLIPAVSA